MANKGVIIIFDTIKLSIPFTLSQSEMVAIDWNKTNTTVLHRHGAVRRVFKHFHAGGNRPRLIYSYAEDLPSKSLLTIEVSIPKFLYGNNLASFQQSDVEKFFSTMRRYIASVMMVPLARVPSLHTAATRKLHLCVNLEVGDLKRAYLKALARVTVPRYKRSTHGNGTTVEWRSVTRKVKIYDKLYEIQCTLGEKEQQLKKSLLANSVGILRLEIELSNYDMRQKSANRLATELLDFDWARALLESWLTEIGFHNEVGVLPLEYWVGMVEMNEAVGKGNKEALIAFVCHLAVHGRVWAQEYYSKRTYQRHRATLFSVFGIRELSFYEAYLPPLTIGPHRSAIQSGLA